MKICREPANKTAIVYRAGMNFRTVNPYLEQLIKSGHLEVLQIGRRTLYQATERGRELEKSLRDILNNLET